LPKKSSGGILENQGKNNSVFGYSKVENFQIFMKINNSSPILQKKLTFLLKIEGSMKNLP